MRKKTFLIISTISAFAATALVAENAIILESFEENIDSVAQGTWGGSRIPDGVVFSQYTKTGDDDINVTHGTNSLKVDLSLSEGWVHDFQITLSEEASAKIRAAAAATNDVARYIVRYDIIFPAGMYWMNNQAFFGNINDQLNTPSGDNGGKATMSWSVDLVQGLPEEGQIVLRFADNFDSKEDPFVGPVSLYVDNIRLVDTYAPGAKAVTTVLQSFEGASNPTGGAADFTAWGGTPRTTYSQYTKDAQADPPDIKVTDGTKSLKVDYSNGGDWGADFTLPFTNTMLAQVLKLDLPQEQRPTPAELERYTLRYDVIYPDRNDNGEPQWEVTQPFAYNGSWLPFGQARRDGAMGLVQTISVTLDQIPSWDANVEGAPVLVFVAQGDFDATGNFTLYYDNFRLIDTGASAAVQPHIDSIKLNAQGKVVITWTGTGSLQSSPTLISPQWGNVTGATSGSPIDPPASGVAFYRIAQ